jgi:hypothetical protein
MFNAGSKKFTWLKMLKKSAEISTLYRSWNDQDFLTLWKDANLDVPILIQAKAEYAKLQ